MPGIGEVSVESIWEKDKHKKEIAEKRGYKLVTVWEGDESEIISLINKG